MRPRRLGRTMSAAILHQAPAMSIAQAEREERKEGRPRGRGARRSASKSSPTCVIVSRCCPCEHQADAGEAHPDHPGRDGEDVHRQLIIASLVGAPLFSCDVPGAGSWCSRRDEDSSRPDARCRGCVRRRGGWPSPRSGTLTSWSTSASRRSRAACRFWDIMMTGACRAASIDRMRLRKMKGYGSNAGSPGPGPPCSGRPREQCGEKSG